MGRARRSLVLTLGLGGAALVLAPSPAGFAQSPPAAGAGPDRPAADDLSLRDRALGEPVALGETIEQSLLQLQERWNEWLAAFYQDDPERARQVADALRDDLHELGMTALPDLARGAQVRAVEAARGGDIPRARWALAAADQLDPGRPETSFAAATIERMEGRWGAAAASWLEGVGRVVRHPLELRLWFCDLALYALYCLLLAGGLFVALSMATSGRTLLRELTGWLTRHVPGWTVLPAALLLLVWPMVLPAGIAWLALYWSVLLWGYGSPSERGVLSALWLLLAVVSVAVDLGRERVAVELSPPVRAMEDLRVGRLSGSLFSDLGALEETLPDEPAVQQLVADLYRRLGERERSRTLYRRVLQAEPANAAAMIDLGSYFFYRGDYRTAIGLFEAASKAAPDEARAFFDLSQAYSNAYLFEDSRRALSRAQVLAAVDVSRWIAQVGDRGVKNADGGLARLPEIRQRLAADARHPNRDGGRSLWLHRGWALLVALVAALAAWGLARLRSRREEGTGWEEREAPAVLEESAWARALVPGADSLLAGRGPSAYLALLLPSALLLLPLAGSLGVSVSTAYAGAGFVVPLAAVGFVLLYAARALATLRAGG